MFRDLKKPLCLITYAILLYFLVTNFSSVMGMLLWFFSLFTPFMIGLIMAYVLNRPYVLLRDKVFCFMDRWKNPMAPKVKKWVALLLVYVFFLLIIALCVFMVIPQLFESGDKLVNNIYSYSKSLETMMNQLLDKFHLTNDFWETVNTALNNFTESFGKILTDLFPMLVDVTKNVTTGVLNFFVGLVSSIYFLSGKEKLLAQLNRLIRAFFPPKIRERFYRVANLSNHMFGDFIIGQVNNALIVGILCFIGMSVMQLDYAMLISVLMTICNIIPFFGALIGAIPSIFILLMVDPWQALWFTIFICVLQQVDGNVIGPKVVGGSIGLSGLWVMVAIILSSSLAGVAGMFLGVPVFAVFYSLLRDFTRRKELKNCQKRKAAENSTTEEKLPETEKPSVS